MRYYLKAQCQAAVNLFKYCGTDREQEANAHMDAITAHNAAIASKVYNSIKAGAVAYQTAAHGARMIIYHQSSRNAELIQVSYFTKINGIFEAFSHGEIKTPADLQKRLNVGCYVNLRRA